MGPAFFFAFSSLCLLSTERFLVGILMMVEVVFELESAEVLETREVTEASETQWPNS